MPCTKDDLRAAADAGIITAGQSDLLFDFISARTGTRTRGPDISSASPTTFDVVHLLWYGGALIVMSAMGLFTTLAFSQMGGDALTATALVYAALFAAAGHYLWTVKHLRTPGGLLIAVAVSMAPLAVYGIQDAFGAWGQFGSPNKIGDFYVWIKGSFVFMELAAIAAAALALRFYRFPFIVLIAAIALWFLSMDIVPWITRSWITGSSVSSFETSRRVSVWFGLGIIAAAITVNGRQRTGDFAFWLYLFGVLTFWGGITAASDGTALAKAMYCAMNIGFLAISVFLGRRAFALFGTIGIAIYLGDLAGQVFKDSMLFPFALSLIGIAIIAFGLYYHRHQDAIRGWCDARLPPLLKRLRPANAAAA